MVMTSMYGSHEENEGDTHDPQLSHKVTNGLRTMSFPRLSLYMQYNNDCDFVNVKGHNSVCRLLVIKRKVQMS